jgi:hypothetical protein
MRCDDLVVLAMMEMHGFRYTLAFSVTTRSEFVITRYHTSHIQESAEHWVGVSMRCAYRRNIISCKSMSSCI